MTNKVNFKQAVNCARCNPLSILVLIIICFANTLYGKESPVNGPQLPGKRFSKAEHTQAASLPNTYRNNLLSKYKSRIDNFPANDSIDNTAPNDTVPFNITKKDPNGITRYLVNGTFFITKTDISFSLSDSVIFNYKKWNVSPNNRINYSDRGLLISSFILSYDSAEIKVTSRDSIAGRPTDISIRNLDVRDLTGIINRDTLSASGLLDATLQAGELDKMLTSLTGNISIRKFALLQQPVGDVQMNVQMMDQNTIHATVGVSGNDNNINADANICINNDLQQLEALVNIKKAQIAILNGFMKSTVIMDSGSVNGVVALKGRIRQPEWKGALNFDSIKFTLNQFGTTYSLDKQKVLLDYPAIKFNQFVLKDSLDNSLIADGKISLKNHGEYDLDLAVNSHNFTLISAPKAINNQIYGYGGMDAKVAVKGTSIMPVVTGDIRFNEKTSVRMVLPEKNTSQDAARSVVRFIDRDTFSLSGTEAFRPATAPDTTYKKFLNYKLNIRTDKAASLTIVIDPSTGDELRVKGIAQLNAGIDTNRNMVMSGTYQLDSGYYELNYQFSRKRFNIVEGSTINFNGSTEEALVNIKAEYIVNTKAKNLLGNEVGPVDRAVAKSFEKNIPFRVVLSLTGSLSKPTISFDIELPAKEPIGRQLRATIENKLVQLRTDMAATNKQVFALLVLDRFVGEQSTDFFKGNGGDFSDISRESVSKFLSAALDQIASDLFKGINVDLNLNSYKDFNNDAVSQKKDLNVEVSKNFLNDRLSVTVGRNFGIESRDASTKAAQQKASRFLPDVTVNYNLSSDGKYMIRSYKKNPFEVVLDGYIVETGLAFIVTMDYDKFEELITWKNKKTAE